MLDDHCERLGRPDLPLHGDHVGPGGHDLAHDGVREVDHRLDQLALPGIHVRVLVLVLVLLVLVVGDEVDCGHAEGDRMLEPPAQGIGDPLRTVATDRTGQQVPGEHEHEAEPDQRCGEAEAVEQHGQCPRRRDRGEGEQERVNGAERRLETDPIFEQVCDHRRPAVAGRGIAEGVDTQGTHQ